MTHAIDYDPLAWQADALCAEVAPDVFFPDHGDSTREAKKICGSCEVREKCLAYALENDERIGVWGGKNQRERARMQKARRAG